MNKTHRKNTRRQKKHTKNIKKRVQKRQKRRAHSLSLITPNAEGVRAIPTPQKTQEGIQLLCSVLKDKFAKGRLPGAPAGRKRPRHFYSLGKGVGPQI